jgi:membrane-bound serine protease (ClpP class)
MRLAFPQRLRPRIPPRRVRLALTFVLLMAGIAGACAGVSAQDGAVHILRADAQVNPVLQGYIDRGISDAENQNASAVVIEFNTPGGLVSSMERIVQRIQASEVPVIVYVSPEGGRALSAGLFITVTAHVAAMSPATTIGAATPIMGTGDDIEGAAGRKILNALIAYGREISEERGRNADWVELAIRDAVTAGAREAVELNVVDYVARDINELLDIAEGREVNVRGRMVTLEGLSDAPRVNNNMTWAERLLLLLSDPNIAFLLLSLGGLGLLVELLNPGLLVPGIFGTIFLILAFFSLGTLPVNWAGVALIILAFILFAAEVFVSGFGVLGIGGAVALIAGGLLLTSSEDPDFQVARWLVVAVGIIFAAFSILIITAIVKARRMPTFTGASAMVGAGAVARSDLNPEGTVFLQGEQWHAVAEDGPVREGENVIVTAVKGLTLRVRPQKKEQRDQGK